MNAPSEAVALLRQIFFQQGREAARFDTAVSWLGWLGRELTTGFGVAALLCLAVLVVGLIIYRPRLRRGSLWVPAFGLFGGAPTLYLHTRPASYCGWFQHTRRLRQKSNPHARGM